MNSQTPSRDAPRGVLSNAQALRWFARLAGALLALELIASVWLLLAHQWQVLRFPFPLDYGEGPLLDHVLRFAHFENPYPPDLTSAPFHMAVYPPLYPALQVPFFWWFGPALWYGRLLSVIGLFAAALASGLIARELTRDDLAAWIAAGLLLASPFAVYWSPLARVDCLALGVGLFGLYFAVRSPGRRSDRIAAALLFVAAAYTRQSAVVAAPFAAFVFNWAARGARSAFELAAWTAGVGLAVLGALLLATSAGFWSNAVTAHDVAFNWREVVGLALELLRLLPGLLLGAAIYVGLGVRRRDATWMGLVAFALASMVVAISGGKVGSNVNYLLEPVAGVGLATAALVASLGHRPLLRALLCLGLAVQVHWLMAASREDYAQREMWKIERRDEVARLFEQVGTTDGLVVADEFMALIPLSGRRLVFQPFAFSALAVAGRWDETALLESLRRGDFELLLLFQPPDWPALQTRWTPAMIEVIEEFYTLEEEIAHTLVARPGAKAALYRRTQEAGAQQGDRPK